MGAMPVKGADMAPGNIPPVIMAPVVGGKSARGPKCGDVVTAAEGRTDTGDS